MTRSPETIKVVTRAIRAAEAALAAAFAVAPTYCRWTYDVYDGSWNTGCGHAFTFNDGGPVENSQKFCGYCGGKLLAKS
jgi:hypothetical protein